MFVCQLTYGHDDRHDLLSLRQLGVQLEHRLHLRKQLQADLLPQLGTLQADRHCDHVEGSVISHDSRRPRDVREQRTWFTTARRRGSQADGTIIYDHR